MPKQVISSTTGVQVFNAVYGNPLVRIKFSSKTDFFHFLIFDKGTGISLPKDSTIYKYFRLDKTRICIPNKLSEEYINADQNMILNHYEKLSDIPVTIVLSSIQRLSSDANDASHSILSLCQKLEELITSLDFTENTDSLFWYTLTYYILSAKVLDFSIFAIDATTFPEPKSISFEDMSAFYNNMLRFCGVSSRMGKREILRAAAMNTKNPLIMYEAASIKLFEQPFSASNYNEALKLYKKAMLLGHPCAAWSIAFNIWHPHNVEDIGDDSEATRIKRQNEIKADPEAYYSRMNKALDYFIYAAAQQQGLAYNSLGNISAEIGRLEKPYIYPSVTLIIEKLTNFLGTKDDNLDSIKRQCYSIAIDLGNPNARHNLGYIITSDVYALVQQYFFTKQENGRQRAALHSTIKKTVNHAIELLESALTYDLIAESGFILGLLYAGLYKKDNGEICPIIDTDNTSYSKFLFDLTREEALSNAERCFLLGTKNDFNTRYQKLCAKAILDYLDIDSVEIVEYCRGILEG